MEAVEKCGITEVVDRNLAIEAFKKEVENLEAEKSHLLVEVGELRSVRRDLEVLQVKFDALSQDLEATKAAEQLVVDCATKAGEVADALRKEVDAERESAAALRTQVEMLTKRLDGMKSLGVSTV